MIVILAGKTVKGNVNIQVHEPDKEDVPVGGLGE